MAKKKDTTESKGQLESLLAELGKKIDVLIAETKNATADVRKDMESTIQDLKQKRDKLEDEIRGIRDKNEPKWNEAKGHLNAAAGEIKKAIDTLFKKKG